MLTNRPSWSLRKRVPRLVYPGWRRQLGSGSGGRKGDHPGAGSYDVAYATSVYRAKRGVYARRAAAIQAEAFAKGGTGHTPLRRGRRRT
jgi:hypothetical protein